jgi:hypothetical protein
VPFGKLSILAVERVTGIGWIDLDAIVVAVFLICIHDGIVDGVTTRRHKENTDHSEED